ncbi:polysaccharide biosynthesis protein [Alkalibacillus almallahensis]|uniref:polysaccharide biosynthesis protein n=1 Tax=Alkalibacillus almallahensis TaxID=1379154 RepID=UPI0014227157|nr:polysaccharide biosynthesis protein [Alkalibacillus almallahensis]NIK12702.1 PST family polysaccharide transporter [Alkalibacillus almallahensis]
MSRADQWLKGTIILTIAGFIGKILGMVYRIPLQNLAGDEGLYIYQQIYPLISLALMLSIYSFPSAISHTLSHELNQNAQARLHNASAVFYLLCGTGFVISLSLFLLAPEIVELMGDPALLEAVRMSSLLFLLIPFTAFLRGLFQTKGQPAAVAWSQIIEQFIRVIGIIVATILIVQTSASLYTLGYVASLATIVGTIVAFALLLILFKQSRFRHQLSFGLPITISKKLVQSLMTGMIIYSLTHILHLLLQLVDVMTMVRGLEQFGLTFEQAKVAKGVFDRGNPLIQLGLVFGSALAFAIVPAFEQVSGQISKLDERLAFKVTWLLSLSAAGGLVVIMPWLNPLFYQSSDGTSTIQWLVMLVFILSLLMALSVMLQAYQVRLQQLLGVGLLLVLKVSLNIWLIPIHGIMGGALSSVIASLLVLILCYITWIKQSQLTNLLPFTIKATGSVLLMVALVSLFSFGLEALGLLQEDQRWLLSIAVVLMCGLGVVVILFMMTQSKLFNIYERQTLAQLPQIGKWFKD